MIRRPERITTNKIVSHCVTFKLQQQQRKDQINICQTNAIRYTLFQLIIIRMLWIKLFIIVYQREGNAHYKFNSKRYLFAVR